MSARKVKPTRGLRRGGGQLDPAPFRAAIRRDLVACAADTDQSPSSRVNNAGLELLAVRSRTNLRTLDRVLTGEAASVTLDVVDAYCCATGRHIIDIYPHLYDEEQVEADVRKSDRIYSPAGQAEYERLRDKASRERAASTPEEKRARALRMADQARARRAALAEQAA